MTKKNNIKILIGAANKTLKDIEDNSVDCCVTSPPYFALRDYMEAGWEGGDEGCDHVKDPTKTKKFDNEEFNKGHPSREETKTKGYYFDDICEKCGATRNNEQIGTEETPEQYIENLVSVFREIKRILKPEGVCFINIGDTYCSTGSKKDTKYPKYPEGRNGQAVAKNNKIQGIKSKDLIGIPWMLAFALRDDGWYLRQEIIWAKACSGIYSGGTVMPECLSPDTVIYIKDKYGIIKRTNLDFLYNNKSKLSEFKIMTPNGWKDINHVWKNNKMAYEINVGNVERVIASAEHQFPTVSDIRRSKITNTKTNELNKKRWMIYTGIEHFLDNQNDSVDMIGAILEANEKNVFVECDYKILKTKKQKTAPFWENLLSKYNFRFTKNKSSFDGPMKDKIINNLIPPAVVLGEGINYDNLCLKSSVSAGKMPCKIKLTYEMGKFIGLYAADGGFVRADRYPTMRGAGKFTFHRNETQLVDFIIKILKQYNIIGRVTYSKTDKSVTVTFNSLVMSVFLKHMVRGLCKNKSLNMDVILNAPKDFRMGVLNGVVDGDGHRQENSRWSYASASDTLSCDIKTIASSVGIVCGKCKTTAVRNTTICNSTNVYTQYLGRKKIKNLDAVGLCPREVVSLNKEIEMIDIEVDGGVFIIGDGLVSHNSTKDRFCRSHEQVFMLTKSKQYYFDYEAIAEEQKEISLKRAYANNNMDARKGKGNEQYAISGKNQDKAYAKMRERIEAGEKMTRNRRSVWTINIRPSKVKHFAPYPFELVKPCILAGCPEGGIVVDPFGGTGTTAIAANILGRNAIHCDLDPRSEHFLEERRDEIIKQRLTDGDDIVDGKVAKVRKLF